ncbi:MAG: DUF885 family protein [Proteobacteria bacterium]|nr:DUF885 family protein [Pseudomonadota bacterium]
MDLHPARNRSRTLTTPLDRFFAQYYDRHPVNATFTGVHANDHRLPDWSRAARAAEVGELRALREDLQRAHPLPGDAVLSAGGDLLDAELARANIDVRVAEYESGFFHDRNPALWTGEAIFGAVSLMLRPFAPRAERLPALASRLAAAPAFLAAARDSIAASPERWRERALKECRVAERLFSDGLTQWLAEEPSDAALETAVRSAAAEACAGFAHCAEWLASLPVSVADSYSAGVTTFETLLGRGHLSDEAPDALLRRAEQDLVTQQARLAELTAPFGSWSKASAEMATDHPPASHYLEAFSTKWTGCRGFAHSYDVVHWPDWPIRYVPMPAWAREYAPQLYWLFYRAPAPFDRYESMDYLVTPVDASLSPEEQERRLRAWNHSTITLNHVVHHGALGHHVQNWHAYHQTLSRIGTIAAVDCASRIGMFLGGSMAEGWACYATDLMDELGFLTELERLSEQHTRVRMLARAIVDIRLHTGTMTFDDAVAYYMNVVGMSAEVAAAESTKNSMFPCTALMYWLGTSGIVALRERVRATRGAAFTLRTFHDELLGWGSIPVPLVARLMTAGAR